MTQDPEQQVLPYTCSYEALANSLSRQRTAHRPILICIDGPGASGKSTIANHLAMASDEIQVVHVDDFYRPSSDRYAGPMAERPIGADFDLSRLRVEVLVPLRAGLAASYHVYDWTTDRLSTHTLPVTKPIVIVEGVHSLSEALSEFFDLSLWVECPRDVRLARGLARDGEAARSRWEHDWMLGEDQYAVRERPRDRATLICDGNRDDLSRQVVILEDRRR
jgi:uridine kinase